MRPPGLPTFPKMQRTASKVFCKVRQALELPPNVVSSHHTNDCKRKTMLNEINLDEQCNEYGYEHDGNSAQQYYEGAGYGYQD